MRGWIWLAMHSLSTRQYGVHRYFDILISLVHGHNLLNLLKVWRGDALFWDIGDTQGLACSPGYEAICRA